MAIHDTITRRTAKLGLGVHVYFEPRDIWVGVFWDREPEYNATRAKGMVQVAWLWSVYVCVIPMVPIRVRWITSSKAGSGNPTLSPAEEEG